MTTGFLLSRDRENNSIPQRCAPLHGAVLSTFNPCGEFFGPPWPRFTPAACDSDGDGLDRRWDTILTVCSLRSRIHTTSRFSRGLWASGEKTPATAKPEFLIAARTRQYDIVSHIAEYAPSLKEKCRGMNKLFSLVENQAIGVVLITYPDRLVRFGFPYLEQAFGGPGVGLEVLEQRKPLEAAEELPHDLLMLMCDLPEYIWQST